MNNIINVTDNALKKFKEVILQENIHKIRISVIGGGCAGLQFNLELKDETFDYDWIFYIDDICFVIDQFSATFLQNIIIDYIDDFMGGFKFIPAENSAISRQCGCGSSFGI